MAIQQMRSHEYADAGAVAKKMAATPSCFKDPDRRTQLHLAQKNKFDRQI